MLPTQLTAPATGASTGTSAGSGLSLRTQGSGPGSTARLASARLASGVCATGVCATGVCATGARRLRYWRLRDWRRRARAWPTVDAPNRQLRLREAVGERVRRQPLDLTAPRLRVCPSRRRTVRETATTLQPASASVWQTRLPTKPLPPKTAIRGGVEAVVAAQSAASMMRSAVEGGDATASRRRTRSRCACNAIRSPGGGKGHRRRFGNYLRR